MVRTVLGNDGAVVNKVLLLRVRFYQR
jgi:hypothetical protein